MVSAPPKILTNAWVKASWEEFLKAAEQPGLEKASCYYDNGSMRLENTPTGFSHGRNHALLALAIQLYGTLQNLSFISIDNGSFRKMGERECQPDLAYYFGNPLLEIPPGNEPVSVDLYGPPTLSIEISASTLSDDTGPKRLLYERLGVDEYWIVDVAGNSIIALAVADGGSRQIRTSMVLPSLQISILEEALKRIQSEDDGAVNRWLLKQFA